MLTADVYGAGEADQRADRVWIGKIQGRAAAKFMTDEERAELTTQIAVASTSGMFAGLAIAGALAQKGLVSSLEIAAWADTLAVVQTGDKLGPVNDTIAEGLKSFASILRSMGTKQPGAGEMRQ